MARALTQEAQKQAEEAANASREPANAAPVLLDQPVDIELQKMLAGVFSGVAVGCAYGWKRYHSPLGCAGAAAVGGLTAAATGGAIYLSNQYAHTSTRIVSLFARSPLTFMLSSTPQGQAIRVLDFHTCGAFFRKRGQNRRPPLVLHDRRCDRRLPPRGHLHPCD